MADPEPDLRASITQPRVWRARAARDDWRTSLLLFVALVAVIPGLHSILVGTAWLVELAAVGLVVLGASAVTRLISASRWLPPVISVAVFVAGLTAVFAPATAFLAVIPTADTFALFSKLLGDAAESINVQTLPATADLGITFLMCIGVGAVAFVADLVAIAFGAPALAGIPLLVLLAAPADIDPGSSDPITFVLAAMAYLLLLRVGSRRGQAQLSLGLGAAILALTIVLSLVLPSADDGSSVASGGSFGSGVNPVLSLGSDLRQGSDRTVLTYSTTNGAGEYLRLVSVSDFSGANWQPDATTASRSNTVDKIGPPPGLTTAIDRTTDTTTVRVGSLTSSWLPLPYPPTRVTGLDGSWFWSKDGLSVTSPDRTTRGQRYTVSDLVVEPTPDQLLAAGTTVPSGLDRYLVVPQGMPAIVAETAKKVVGSAPTDYEKALLLQSYFHDGDFTYSETAPVSKNYDGTGGQVIAKFLKAKAGYCIHFASAMAVMARSLGIPARISVGFLPGQPISASGDTATYEVTTHDLHAWPELYFAGVGWTRFEPTVSRGDVPSYADITDPSVPEASATDNPAPTTTSAPTKAPADVATAAPTSSPTALGTSTERTSGVGSGPWLALALLIVLALGLTPGAVRAVQRSRRIRGLETARTPAIVGWREVLQTSTDVGTPIADTLTPREAAVALGVGRHPALDRMLDALERERFARDPRAYPGAADDTRALVALVFGTVRPRRRIIVALFPPSLWRRITRMPGIQ